MAHLEVPGITRTAALASSLDVRVTPVSVSDATLTPMRLIKTTFGFEAGDPMVPSCEFMGAEERSPDTTWLSWWSVLPRAADESTTAVRLDQRAEAAVEIAVDLGGVTPPWQIEITPTPEHIELEIVATGAAGWHEQLSALAFQVLSARALEISATVWAAWHATGHARCGDHARGILWLVGAGAEWADALEITASLALA